LNRRVFSRLGALLSGLVLSLSSGGEVIHKERSIYRNIEVQQKGSERCLVFATRRDDRRQTCVDLKAPDRVVFSYVRMTFGGLLLAPNPSSILVIGLGGGTLPSALSKLYPEAGIDAIEIDAAVVQVAEDYFDFQSNNRINVHIQDARVYTKRAGQNGTTYDLIILDAFTGDYIPEHLMTREYLEETRALLAPGGVVVANTFSASDLYSYESETYRAVFGPFFNFKLPGSGNRVIIARPDGLPDRTTLALAAKQLAPSLAPFGIAITEFPRHLTSKTDWDRNAPILTDQFSPANLLKNR